MITFLDEKDVEYGALATIKVTNAVNGERSLTGEIESGDYVLSNIERGWRLRFEDEFYVVTYAKPIDDGKTTHVTFDAVHQFFWDFDKSSVHEQLNDGSHTFLTYLDFIFTGSGYTYTIAPLLKVYAFEKQSFGYKSRLNLFNDVITSSGVEFQVNGKVVRILEKTGTDLSTVVRKNFNMNELGIEKNIGDFVTYQKGFGAWIDENDHSKGRLVTEYTSPLASVYGKLEAEPLVDERYTQADNMIAALKANVDNSYSISVRLDMEDLTRAGYDYTQPRAGDYIMAINETLGFKEKIRIVSFTSEYDVSGQLVKHEVTCNDIGVVKKLSASYNLTKEQAQNASDSVGKAVEMANKALVSADGKSTVYFGNKFPKDEPKGTLHKGDSLYLTVGDTTKMYYWTGADWEEPPIVNDVEAFKEQIADELKDVPNREEFEATITEKLATSKAEIKTQIDTAKTQAESNAKAYADEINQATAEVAEQANTAANSLKSDLAKVKTDLTTTTSTANAAKTSASEAKQQLTTVANDLSKAKTDLQNAVSAVDTKATNLQSDLTKAKQDLTNQAQQLQAQASAQSELTKRVSSVEKTANGTKTTVSELSKTVDSNTKNISSVTARTKTVEDDLTSTKTTLSQVKTTANSASQKTATLETGLNGLTSKFETLKIGSRNYFKNSKSRKYYINNIETQNVKTYIDNDFWQNDTRFTEGHVRMSFDIAFNPALPSDFKTNVHFNTSPYPHCGGIKLKGGTTALQHFDLKFDFSGVDKSYRTDSVFIKLKNTLPARTAVSLENFNLYLSAVVEDYNKNEADIETKVAEYKQNADQNYASLQTTVQNLDGTVQQNKTVADQTAAGFKTRIESLETYQSGESTRANQYFESAKTETARQLTAERTAIAKDYVAKSTYTSDVTGIRNDLTATTTTADTTKTNLANYQASNDKLVANLQSNLQTTNGNVSSLKTKIEAVPGQISSAISTVEGKIPTEIGSSNLLRKTAVNTDNLIYFTAWNVSVSVDGQAFKIVTTEAKSGGSGFIGNNNIYNLIKDRDYTFGFWILANKDKAYNYNDLGHFQVVGEDNTTNNLTTPVYNLTTIKAGVWTRVYCTFKATATAYFRPYFLGLKSGDEIHIRDLMLNEGKIPLTYTPAFEDDISKLNTTLTQTANGLTQLSTKVTSQGNTITSHTNSINSLTTGLSAKVSQTDFNTLSGRVTTAENNITAKANELSSKITSVEGKIPTSVGGRNLIRNSTGNLGSLEHWVHSSVSTMTVIDSGLEGVSSAFNIKADLSKITSRTFFDNISFPKEDLSQKTYVISGYFKNNKTVATEIQFWIRGSSGGESFAANITFNLPADGKWHYFTATGKGNKTVTDFKSYPRLQLSLSSGQNHDFDVCKIKVEYGNIPTDWTPAPEDYDSKLATAQSEIKQTTDAIKASVQSLDNSTVKSSSLTINTDGVVIKAGKSTSDFANAVGSYFGVNQNAINLFSDKINVKGNMIVSGAITSDKIASKQINTAHLNGKIITADVISSNAVTADAIKAGAVTTDKMSANSINGDRITAGTLDAAKIKAGSITASQIASGTITSAQIKTGTISAANIAAGAITADKIAANSISSDKIVSSGITADVISGGVLKAANDAMQINLNSSNITFSEDASVIFTSSDNALKRVITGKPSQFIKMCDSVFVSEIGELPDSTLTVIASNSDRTENIDSAGFGGMKIWNGSSSTDSTSFVELVGNRVAIYGNKNRSPWLFDMTTTTSSLIPQNSNGIKHTLGRSDRPFYSVHATDVYIQGERVAMMLKDIALHIGYKGNNGWVDRIS